MEFLNTKQKVILIIVCFTIILLVGLYIISKADNNYEEIEENTTLIENETASKENTEDAEDTEEDNTIILHITGAVENEGIIKLEKGARIVDAIEEAGGVTKEADLSKVNLAYSLEDGQKIYIPSEGEEKTEYILEEKTENIVEGNKTNQIQIININTASQTELETLTGIGPSTALKIINYRNENGKFNSIEDIKNVSGIGETKFEGFKNEICIK